MRRRLLTVIAAVTVLLTVAGVAVAAAPDGRGDVALHGKGGLWAKGRGTAVLDGGGVVRMKISGDVVITDHTGDATIRISDGPDSATESTRIVLTDFTGAISVRGSGFTVEATGDMKLHAKGRGTAFLSGRGVYFTRHGHGRWTPDGVEVAITE